MNFVKLTDKDTGKNLYVEEREIVIVAPLTEDILHKHDYDYETKRKNYDSTVVFTGIQTRHGIIHVKESTDEVVEMLRQ